eukprot:gnl/MRDRNA2_/MRDRNA2_85560_c0_seq2.p1 gnl/MRDRNA2_/MRDRNA2_85560_c0~~gnl/MRDRNA2_/MRDRNA2_85560_c0_seq2.p1  ORF type:complete len:499 (+),score=9.29 gnl/MRDRNA2_/MRDRNA2_85560_c0_seq2:167-1498(+)
MPRGKEFQQTIRSSFTLTGIGLHSSEFAFLRLRPAAAKEGRYLVRVPKGFISESSSFISAQLTTEGETSHTTEMSSNLNNTLESLRVDAFLAYHNSKAKGYEGSIEEFEEEIYHRNYFGFTEEFNKKLNLSLKPQDFLTLPRSNEDNVVPATIDFARGEIYYTSLEAGGETFKSVEHMLASLEACGVDNCRIEVENGNEIPTIEGSAHGWTTLITRVGVVPCDTKEEKKLLSINKAVSITGSDNSFMNATVSESILITAGWDAISRGAPCLGRSWFTWDVEYDLHFHYSIAPAKTFYHSAFELDVLYDSGLVQAGPTFCAIVGMGEGFSDPSEVTFPEDEASRHKIIDVTGDLALLSQQGHGGLPRGHVCSWTTDHTLQTKFCTLLWNDLKHRVSDFVAYDLTLRSLRPLYKNDTGVTYDLLDENKAGTVEKENLRRIKEIIK